MLDSIVIQFETYKYWLVQETTLPDDALHIYIGLAIFLLIRLIWRGRGGWIVAWIVTCGIAALGEWFDARSLHTIGSIVDGPGHWRDIINTTLAPTVLLLISPLLPARRMKPAPTGTPAEAVPSGDEREDALEQA